MTNPPVNTRGLHEWRNAGGLALVLIEPKDSAFSRFAALPHLARSVVRDTDVALEALESLTRLLLRVPVGRTGQKRAVRGPG